MIEFLHMHLLAILLSLSGVLVAGGTGFVLHRVAIRHDRADGRTNKRAEPRWTRRSERKHRGSVNRRKRWRGRASR